MKIVQSIEKIRQFAKSNACRSKNWLAKEAGVSEYVTRNIFSDDWNPMADSLQKLEAVVERHSPK